MQNPNVTKIRSLSLTRVNRLVRAAAHLETLTAAFEQWAAGEIYVCKKTASYRYRFGAKSKSPTEWSKLAESVFTSAAEFALAAVVLAPVVEKVAAETAPTFAVLPDAAPAGRVDVIALAQSFKVA